MHTESGFQKKYLPTHFSESQKLSFIKDNNESQFLVEHLQKIITAIYLVTDLLDDENELKSFIRKSANKSLSKMFHYMRKKDTASFESISNYLYETNAFLLLSFRSEFISEMNYQILVSEIESFVLSLKENQIKTTPIKELDSGKVSLEDFFKKDFYQEERKEVQKDKVENQTEKEKTDIIIEEVDIKIERKNIEKKPTSFVSEKLMPELSHVKKPAFKKITKGEAPKAKTKQLAKDKRHDAIRSVLSENKDISIKDVCLYIEGCSSKTIQRDLNEMIEQGIVMKKGDRRWSTYRLR